jgi:MYXO-CTERM domain-containing protein
MGNLAHMLGFTANRIWKILDHIQNLTHCMTCHMPVYFYTSATGFSLNSTVLHGYSCCHGTLRKYAAKVWSFEIMKMKNKKMLFAGLLGIAFTAVQAQAASLTSVMASLAEATGNVNQEADYTFSLASAGSTFAVVDNNPLNPLVAAGDVLNTSFLFSQVSVDSTSTVLNAPINSGTFASTVAVFGTSSLLVTSTTATTITVTANPTTDPLFSIYEIDNMGTPLSIDNPLPGSPPADLFATVGGPTVPATEFTFLVQSLTVSEGALAGLDVNVVLNSLLVNTDPNLTDPSTVSISGLSADASGEFTISATVVPSPAAAGFGMIGLLGLSTRRRRKTASDS